MTKEEFVKNIKHHIIKKYPQCTGRFYSKLDMTIEYHVYVCLDKLEVIDPNRNKYKDRSYKTFVSYNSGRESKEMAYDYIQKQKSLRPVNLFNKPILKEDLYRFKMWAEAILQINKTELPHYLKLNEEPLSKTLVRKCLNTV